MRRNICINIFIGLLLFIAFIEFVNAQPGPSFSVSYDLFPYSNLVEPEDTFEEDLKIRIANLKLKASYPEAILEQKPLAKPPELELFPPDCHL